MLKDFRESFAADLRDPEFQREFIAAYYEEEGVEGLLRALSVIADANRDQAAPTPSNDSARTASRRSIVRRTNPAFRTVRAALNALDLDLTIVRKS